ncbi:MAG TPA: arginine--tRNA ligase [Bryobacteraceae bacterium]|nr:arginine--tRNA ligase [Bryobacteraceae bacterium]
MFHSIEKQISERVAAYVRSRYGAETVAPLEQPKQASFGELAIPVAFHLARQLKQAPKAIASQIVAELGTIEGVSALEVAGNGYINVRLDRAAYGLGVLEHSGQPPAPLPGKIIVEHTNINPNKAAHIGHLRNAVLGDTFVRMLRARSHTVEVQNYIDNTGVQVADVVAGFHYLRKMSYDEVVELMRTQRFDYYCWELYAEVSAHPELKEWRQHTLHAIEHRQGELVHLASKISEVIVGYHLNTMARLGVTYDLLPRESDVVWLKFWETAFEQLKERKAIYFETGGKNKGCWVMPASAFKEQTGEDTEDSKVIVRSNNTVTYVGKDIAYQLWKFGLLPGKDFYYLRWPDKNVYITTAEPQPPPPHEFGHASSVYNVIDSRQSYLQDVVVAGLRALGYNDQADRSIHFSYEMVALSPRTCVELGIEIPEEDKKRPYVEVSGRKGLGVKADDLIDKLIEKALEEVDSRHPEAPQTERRAVAAQIAIGALRYFMLKYTRNSVIAFDLQEALSFEGETGPYVQYSTVRARNILRKLEERGETLPDFGHELDSATFARQLGAEDFWQLLLIASKADSAVERAIASGEPAHVAKYAFQLAQAFNNFYHAYPVLTEENREKRTFLLWITGYVRAQLEGTLGILGIQVPEYM